MLELALKMANVLKCPLCGCDVPPSRQKLIVAPSTTNEAVTAEVVVCHCPENHRFVVSLKDTARKAHHA
jgi:hypothetical protein